MTGTLWSEYSSDEDESDSPIIHSKVGAKSQHHLFPQLKMNP